MVVLLPVLVTDPSVAAAIIMVSTGPLRPVLRFMLPAAVPLQEQDGAAVMDIVYIFSIQVDLKPDTRITANCWLK